MNSNIFPSPCSLPEAITICKFFGLGKCPEPFLQPRGRLLDAGGAGPRAEARSLLRGLYSKLFIKIRWKNKMSIFA